MLKDRTKFRLFLLLCVIIFTIVAAVGCQNGVDATYIRGRCWDSDWKSAIPLIVVDNHPDLVAILGISTPEKYDDDFFKTKSLLFFGIVEESGGCVSEIKSYAIKNNTISVHVKTKKHGVTADIGYWCFMLELTKKEVESFKNVKLFHDGKDITRDYDGEEIVDTEKLILDYVNYAYSIGQKDVTVENTEILVNYGVYDGAVIVRMNRGAYQVPTNISFLGTGVKIQFPDTNTPLVYKNGNFYELHDAYMNGILTKESLIKLQNKIANG